MIASRDYRLTNEIINLYKQIFWEVFTLIYDGCKFHVVAKVYIKHASNFVIFWTAW
jgi:hypothetical protein